MVIVPNLLTLYRLICLPLLVYYLSQGRTYFSIAIFFSAVLSDFLDGFLARRFSLVSKLGKIFDPIADKAFVVGIFVYFFLRGMVPFWFLAIILCRDLSQLVGFLFLWIKKVHIHMRAELIGKLSTGANFLVIFFLILSPVIQGLSSHVIPAKAGTQSLNRVGTSGDPGLIFSLFLFASIFTLLSLLYYALIWSRFYRSSLNS